MEGRIDTSFQTVQRDLFSSGMAAQIGMNAFGVWLAIKSHADFKTGEAWPGLRRLAALTGLAVGTVSNAVQILIDARLLRVVGEVKGRGNKGRKYVACERIDVRIGDRILCTIVLDYVPARLRQNISAIDQALRAGEPAPETFAQCEIIPGEGFAWDAQRGVLTASIPARDLPPPSPEVDEAALTAPLARRVLELGKSARRSRSS